MSYTTRTGYYLPVDQHNNSKGALRHAHTLKGRDEGHFWHYASEVHFDDPTAHINARSWDATEVVWAVANVSIPASVKIRLINEARDNHNNTNAHARSTQKINVGCPDCGVIFEGTLVYRSEGRWDFEYECSNSKCSNFQYEYVGTIKEK